MNKYNDKIKIKNVLGISPNKNKIITSKNKVFYINYFNLEYNIIYLWKNDNFMGIY